MLNASVGVQRVIGRLRRPQSPSPATYRAEPTVGSRRLRPAAARPMSPARRRGAPRLVVPSLSMRSLLVPVLALRQGVLQLGHERTVAVSVAAIVLAASFLSLGPGGASAGDTGGPSGDGPAPRIAVGGDAGDEGLLEDSQGTGSVDASYVDEGAVDPAAEQPQDVADTTSDAIVAAPAEEVDTLTRIAGIDGEDPEAQAVIAERAAETAAVAGPFLDDGTLLKPVAVDTTVADGSALVTTYKVKTGDTLVGIARAHGVSMMTLWWANKLKDKDDLHRGQILKIPAVNGVVVQVKPNDTLTSLAREYRITEDKILATNGITDPNLVVGQVLVLPGAKGDPIPTPKPTKKPTVARSGGSSRSGGGGSTRPPKTYTGGRFAWPAPGGRISQYYHYGHYGLDIDGDTGDRIVAAASGTVTFAGWKNNGGGYQVWIAHGSGLYTTYNHMSSVAVGKGQHVSKGQRVGRMGATGYVTGSHLHFEVWKGPIWNGGRRVNPLSYY